MCMCASVFFFDSLLEYLLCHKSMFLSACTWRDCVKEQIASHTYSLAAIFFTLFVPKRAKSHKQLFILSISICMVLWICLFFFLVGFLAFSEILLGSGFVSLRYLFVCLCETMYRKSFEYISRNAVNVDSIRTCSHICMWLYGICFVPVFLSYHLFVFSIKVSNLRCDSFSNGIINLNWTKNRNINKMSKQRKWNKC